MPEIEIDARYQPFIDALLTATVVATAVWLALVIFIMLRRRASNLTPIQAAPRKDVRPGFLTVDHKKQADMKRDGAAYDAELARREEDEEAEKAARQDAKRPDTMLARFARLISVIMSVFTLATLIGGVIFNVNYIGGMLREYSTVDRIIAVVSHYPIAVTVAVLVIGYHVYSYIAGRKWKPA
jgi:hypothetical protein